MISLKYTNPIHEYYLVFDLEKAEDEFDKYKWNIPELISKYRPSEEKKPFSVLLSQLMMHLSL